MKRETKQLQMEKDQVTAVYVTISCTLVRRVDCKQAITCETQDWGTFSVKTAKSDS